MLFVRRAPHQTLCSRRSPSAPPLPCSPAAQCDSSRCQICHENGQRCMQCKWGKGFDYQGYCKNVRWLPLLPPPLLRRPAVR